MKFRISEAILSLQWPAFLHTNLIPHSWNHRAESCMLAWPRAPGQWYAMVDPRPSTASTSGMFLVNSQAPPRSTESETLYFYVPSEYSDRCSNLRTTNLGQIQGSSSRIIQQLRASYSNPHCLQTDSIQPSLFLAICACSHPLTGDPWLLTDFIIPSSLDRWIVSHSQIRNISLSPNSASQLLLPIPFYSKKPV